MRPIVLPYFAFILFFFVSNSSLSQSVNSDKKFKDIPKTTFQFQGRNAWIMSPIKPIDGNPWVWRAHFPDWHTQMDSILLDRGFHIAYINTNNLFGHPSALTIWDNFYNYLVTEKQFSSKVALEGVSRGGLYIYEWAKRNPSKVSCIYAEAPVLDPKSWPGGKGKSEGSPNDWQKWKTLFQLTDSEASQFTGIPLNDLEGLASYKVPVLHVIGLNDKIVPNEENTYPFLQRYSSLGGPASVYSMTRGPQALEGHHFKIEDPTLFADFIQRHSTPVIKPVEAIHFIEPNKGLATSLKKFREDKIGTVAFLGGSITYNPGWRTKTIQYLKETYPDTQFEFISAGIPSLGSTPHAFRVTTDIFKKGIPDLLFVESAVNDRTNGFSETAQIRALEGIIRNGLAQNSSMDIILMAFIDPDMFTDFDKKQVPLEVTSHRTIAKQYGFPFINLAEEVYNRIKANEFTWEYDFKDLHPSPFGQEVYFNSIKTLLRLPFEQKVKSEILPINSRSYSNGNYLSIQKAQKLKGFSIDSNWKPKDKKGTREGFVNVPVLVGEESGSSFELNFTGTAIGLAVVSGPDAGILEYSIDGKPQRQLDLFSQWSSSLHLPWYLMFDDELKPGKHKIQVKILPNKNIKSIGTAARIVHFLVN